MKNTESSLIKTIVAMNLCLLAGGCGGTGVEGEDNIATTAERVTISPAGLPDTTQYGFMYTWANNGSTPFELPVPFTGTACFLTNIWGSFLSSSDIVRTTVMANPLRWVISGNSGGGTPSGDAYCMTNGGFLLGGETTWTSGAAVPLPKPGGGGNANTNDACFLTGLRGNVANSGYNDTARVYIVNGEWRLDAKAGVQPFARCISHPAFAETTVLTPNAIGLAGTPGHDAYNTLNDREYFCALTRVHGSLRGGWIGTYLYPVNNSGSDTDWDWAMSGFKNPGFFAPQLGASARCTW
jgi:hypothetical protein